MASNFNWLKDSINANKKAMIWAHNGHVMKDNNDPETKMLGETIHEQYGENICSLRLVAYTGIAFECHANKATISFANNNPKSIKYKIHSASNSTTLSSTLTD